MEKEVPPPSYGAVNGQQQPPYPQPGMPYPPSQPYPADAPPGYEPPKDMKDGAPPGPGYQQPYTQQPQTAQQTIIIASMTFGPQPLTLQCPYCEAHVTTTVAYHAGILAWLICGLLCLFGCWLGCCLIPFCVTDLHDCTHTCPNCNRVLGRYNRM